MAELTDVAAPTGDGSGEVVRVAAWQCTPGPLDVAGNLRRLDEVCARAAAAGVEVLVTPEMFTTGYAIGAEAVHRLAEPADGPIVRAVGGIAARHGLAVAFGFPERAGEDPGAVHNAAALVDSAGRLRGLHRKVHLFGDLDRAQFTPGASAPAPVDLAGDPTGLLICYDAEFPEAVRHLAVRGARLVLVPTANMTGYEEVPLVLMRARSYENRCALVYANHCGADDVFEYGGHSVIHGRDGSVLALAGTQEELLVADVDLGAAAAPDYLADRRADLYGGA